MHVPRLAYPLLFLIAGLLLTFWTMDFGPDLGDNGVLGLPPARFSGAVATEADRSYHRDLVMVTLVDE